MGKQAYTDDGKKTTKQTNKEAIQNINRTGTVSGKSSGVTGNNNVVRTNTDTSNLAGNNRQQAYGNPKMTTNSKVNVLGRPSQTQATGKTFVPSISGANRAQAETARQNLQKVQPVLNKVADSSNKKINDVIGSVGNFINQKKNEFYASSRESQEYQKLRKTEQFKEERINQKFEQNMEENRAKAQSITQEEWDSALDENGNIRDFDAEINRIQGEISALDETINFVGADNPLVSNETARKQELLEELDSFKALQDKVKAVEELYTYDQLNKTGDQQSISLFREQLSHKNDNLIQRAGTATQHLAVTTLNLIPETFDQLEQMIHDNTASSAIEEISKQHDAGNIGDEDYEEILGRMQDYADEHLATNSDNLSQQIRAYADQLSANTYYGANDVETFLLQAGESTAQFLVHYAIGSAIAGAVANNAKLIELGRQTLESAQAGSSVGLAEDLLLRAGRNAMGAQISTMTMSLSSATDKMNQLLMQGVDSQTASMNAFMTGLTSYLTEKIGMDNLVEAINTPISKPLFGQALLAHANSALSEGLEEVVEGLIDPVIDYVTLGTPYQINGGELLMEFALGATSGLGMSVGGSVGTAVSNVYNNARLNSIEDVRGIGEYIRQSRDNRNLTMASMAGVNSAITIENRRQRELRLRDMRQIESMYNDMTPEQQSIARYLLDRGRKEVGEYDSKAMLGVTFSTDMVEDYSGEAFDKAIIQTFTPDFNDEVQLEKKFVDFKNNLDAYTAQQQDVKEVNNHTSEVLKSNGYEDINPEVFNTLSEKQQKQTLMAHDLAKAFGYEVEVVNNLKEKVHGYRSQSTGKITIDASEGKNPVLQTLVHEMTHGTENGSLYSNLKQLVRDQYTDEQWAKEIENKKLSYSKNANKELSDTEAEQEIVARYVENRIKDDEDFIEDLVRYNFSFASRLKQNMKAFFSSDENVQFKNTFERTFKNARAELIADTLQKIRDGYEGYVGENYVSKDNLQMSVAQYDVTGREILSKYLSDPASGISEESKNAILDRMEEVYKVMKDFQETGKYPEFSKWQDMFYTVDDRGELSVVINNGDYELNIDFSTVCKKRKMMDKVINALSKNGYLTKALKNTDIANLREVIEKHGFEVACGMCFVDTKRFNQGSWAGRFESKWNGLIDQLSGALDVEDGDVNTFNFQAGLTEGSPALANIDFSDPKLASFVALSEGGSEEARMARTLINHPELRAKVSTNDMYGSSGFEAIQNASPELFKLVNASGGSSKPKLAHTEVTYFNEIINSPKFNPDEARKVGGVRLQSFSDFMANMVFDYVQMFSDMEAKNLTGHSYTKVKEYALLFGKTGMKINLSLIPAGFDSDVYTAEQIAKMNKKSKEFIKLKENAGLKENGDYMFDKESFDFDLAVEIQNLDGYDKNVGTICVGVSDKHILKMLGDDRICMVIPYHRSGISPLVANKMGISTFNDYTNKQNTRFTKSDGKPGKKIGKGFDFNFYEGSDANGKHFAGMIENNYDAKKTADNYLAWCEENGYFPKFGDNPEIRNHPNYYKLLIDFRAYDKNGDIAPQVPVKISGDSGIGSDFVELDVEKNPALAKLYGNDIGFKNVLEKGLDVYEETEARQNEQVEPIMYEMVDELGLKQDIQMSVDNDVQYSVEEDEDGVYVKADKSIFKDENGNSVVSKKKRKEYLRNWILGHLEIKARNADTGALIGLNKHSTKMASPNISDFEVYLKGQLIGVIDDAIRIAKFKRWDKSAKVVGKDTNRSPAIARKGLDFYDFRLGVPTQNGISMFNAELKVNKQDNGDFVYDVEFQDIKKGSRGQHEDGAFAQPDDNSFSAEDEIVNRYNEAVKSEDVETAQNLVRDYARSYAERTGQQMFEGFHGTNAKFNKFLKEKLGSKNFFAQSAYMGFFMAGSEQTAENYTGLNDGDLLKMMWNPEAEEIRKRIREKHNIDELEAQDNANQKQFIEDAWNKELASDSNYARIYSRIMDPELMESAGLSDYADTMAETIRSQWNTEQINGTSRINNLYDEYENSDQHRQLKEAQERASAELNDEYIRFLGYEPNVKHLFAFMKNPLVHDFKNEGRDVDFSVLMKQAKENGNDGVIFQNVQDGGGFDTIYAVFEPNQFKSADPITYDDNGNVIPLEERFNQDTDDLRFSSDDDIGELTVDEDSLPVNDKNPTKKDLENQTVAKVLEEMPKPETKKDVLHRAKLLAEHYMVDRYSAVNDIAKEYKNPKLIHLADKAMRAQGLANTAIYNGVYDSEGKTKIGKSLTEIMGKIPKDQKQLFGEYMYHYRNIDEMSMVERFGKDYKDRPVFGESVTADDSRLRVEEIEKQHPEFKEYAEDMWTLYRQMLEMRRDAGIISQESYEKFLRERPHYVRIVRENGTRTGATSLNPNDIKKFKGSTLNIAPLEDATMLHITSTYRTTVNNELNSEIIKTLGGEEVFDSIDEDMYEAEFNPLGEDPNGKKLFAYKDGKKIAIPINDELYKSLSPAKNSDNALKKIGDMTVAPLSKLRKTVLTSGNFIFSLFTNPMKDVQDAFRNTKYLKAYPRKLLEAVGQVFGDGEYSKQYDNLGLRSSQYIGNDIAKAYERMQNDKGVMKAVHNLLDLGEKIEKIPRVAEFMCALEAGKSVDEASYDASEITTNFKRGGTLSKTMDKYGFTFLNASIQGFDKQVRNAKGDIEKIKKEGVKGVISVMAQLTLASGLPLRALLDWMWKDDDEYEELSDYVKNNYYIVGKTNGRFIRIPKGRIASFYQTVTSNAYKTITDQVNAWDALLDDWQSFNDNVAPNNFLDNNLLSPITQVNMEKTWYGEDLIPSRLQDVPDYEQYDEGTDALSIAIGKLSKQVADAVGSDKLQISPYKVNYLLDQYSGIIGDILLPAFSLETSTSVDGVMKGPATAILDKFTTDPILKNQNVTSFYDLKEVLDTRAKGSEATDEEKLASKYLGTVASAMGKLYGEKRKIQMDSSLSNKEKLSKVREIQTQINDLAREALANYDNIDKTDMYASIGGVAYFKDEDGEWNKPTKTALEKLNSAGLDDEDRGKYFDTYSKITKARETVKKEAGDDKADYRQVTIDAINNSGMSSKGKNTLFDSYYSSKAVDHINSMELSDEQKLSLKIANKMADGVKDENGKTISNSKAKATAEAYRKLGLLEDVLKYIKDNNVAPSELGLSKTVYKELTSGSDYSTAYAKTMRKRSSKTSKTKVKEKKSKVKGVSAGKARALIANPIDSDRSIANSYFKAYANTFNNRYKTSVSQSSGGSVKCPRCGNMVSSSSGRCPICGASL